MANCWFFRLFQSLPMTETRGLWSIASIFVILSCVGCMTMGKPIPPDKVSQIKVGESTKEDVIALLGKPKSVTTISGGMTILGYMHMTSYLKPSDVLLGPVGMLIPSGTRMRHCSVTIGQDNKVQSMSISDDEF